MEQTHRPLLSQQWRNTVPQDLTGWQTPIAETSGLQSTPPGRGDVLTLPAQACSTLCRVLLCCLSCRTLTVSFCMATCGSQGLLSQVSYRAKAVLSTLLSRASSLSDMCSGICRIEEVARGIQTMLKF